MTSTSEAPPPPHVIALPARLDYSSCESLAETLDAARGTPVVLEADQVDSLGAMPVELLLRARLSWQQDGVAFGLGPRSDTFLNGLAQLGLTPEQFETGGAA